MATKEGICLSGCSCSGKLGIKLGFLGYQCGMLWYADCDNLETTEESIGTTDNSLRWPNKLIASLEPSHCPYYSKWQLVQQHHSGHLIFRSKQ